MKKLIDKLVEKSAKKTAKELDKDILKYIIGKEKFNCPICSSHIFISSVQNSREFYDNGSMDNEWTIINVNGECKNCYSEIMIKFHKKSNIVFLK
jgi:DNA-directed RNA polymerase subunit RPC12/RpoP